MNNSPALLHLASHSVHPPGLPGSIRRMDSLCQVFQVTWTSEEPLKSENQVFSLTRLTQHTRNT